MSRVRARAISGGNAIQVWQRFMRRFCLEGPDDRGIYTSCPPVSPCRLERRCHRIAVRGIMQKALAQIGSVSGLIQGLGRFFPSKSINLYGPIQSLSSPYLVTKCFKQNQSLARSSVLLQASSGYAKPRSVLSAKRRTRRAKDGVGDKNRHFSMEQLTIFARLFLKRFTL